MQPQDVTNHHPHPLSRAGRALLPVLVAAIVPGLCGCTGSDDTDPTEQKEILLSATVAATPESRGGSALSTDYTIWVSAVYHHAYEEKHSYYFPAPDYEKPFAWSEVSQIWKGVEENYYYPAAGTIDFLAYAIPSTLTKPAQSYAPALVSAEHSGFEGLTLDFGTTLDGRTPVMVSDIKSAVCSSSAPMAALQFRHLLSCITFTAVSDDLTSGHFVLHRLTLKGVRTSGAVDIIPNATTQAGGSGATTGSAATWQQPLKGDARDIDLYQDATGMKPGTTSTNIGVSCLLPTQSASTLDAAFEIEYSIINGPSATQSPKQTKALVLPATKWLPGIQYIYTLNINLQEISVSSTSTGAIADDWTIVPVTSDEVYP